MKIKDIMTHEVVSASPSSDIIEVADLIFQNRFHGLPIEEKGKLIGIVTEDDFFLKDGSELFLPFYLQFLKENRMYGDLPQDIKSRIEKLLNAKVRDIMTTDCRTVSPEMDAYDMMSIIKETKFTTFPVVDEDKNILGVVTLSDILGTVKKGSAEMKKTLNYQGNKKEIYESAAVLHAFWRDKIISMSKKRVATWKGIAITSVIIGILIIAISIIINKNGSTCGLAEKDSLPTECQKFTYSDWSGCGPNGMQERQVISRAPQGCEGGRPVLFQPCQ
jgi:acetoin utilization protein AcuB